MNQSCHGEHYTDTSNKTPTPPSVSPAEDKPSWESEGGDSIGSGVIIDSDGTILTNAHVVGNATECTVNTAQRNVVTAVLQQKIPEHALAIIRAPGVGTIHALLGDSNALEIGGWVIAAGSSFGLEHSITAGIVSAKGRGVGGMKSSDFIQTDAPITPGNSRGPLVNLRGQVVGINTAIISRSGGNVDIGFAIPVTLVKQWLIAGDSTEGGKWESQRIQELPHSLSGGFLSVPPTTSSDMVPIKNSRFTIFKLHPPVR